MKTVDGFPVQDGFDFLSNIPKPELSPWSAGKVVKIEVAGFYFNPRWVAWKGQKSWVGDFELFKMLIASWIRTDKFDKTKSVTKEQALDDYFEMASFTPNNP